MSDTYLYHSNGCSKVDKRETDALRNLKTRYRVCKLTQPKCVTNYAQYVFEKTIGQPANHVFGSDSNLGDLSDIEKTLEQNMYKVQDHYPKGWKTCYRDKQTGFEEQGPNCVEGSTKYPTYPHLDYDFNFLDQLNLLQHNVHYTEPSKKGQNIDLDVIYTTH